MNDILFQALTEIEALINTPLDVLDIKKPVDIDYARHLFKVLSKLSPLMGNMIEFFIPSVLNKKRWGIDGQWIRQDPSFPDIIFMAEGVAQPIGIEIKTWFPLATEITARFRESQLRLTDMPIQVVVTHLQNGRIKILTMMRCLSRNYSNNGNWLRCTWRRSKPN